jgi:glycosyltransferase involved in cell wall biosynthesis
MKVYLPGLNKVPKSGKGFFYQRLAPALAHLGVKIINDISIPHDISVNSVKLEKGNSKKRVLRLDGVYHNNKQPYKKRNRPISQSLHKSDAIVYQSLFAKKMCNKYLGKFKGSRRVIHNGMDIQFWDNVIPAESSFKYNFLAASRWRPHKRLVDIVESFLLADIPDSCLYIAGDLSKSKVPKQWLKTMLANCKNVVRLGPLKQEELAKYMKLANASLHLCWFDACPNSVVEAISCGTPVVCNNTGGTPELVAAAGGYICDVDSPYDLQPVDLYHPPKIDRRKVADALIKSTVENAIIKRQVVDIHKVAVQYVELFESTLK